MPTYRYRCDTCGEELEVWQSITDPSLTTHETDGGELRKVLSAAGIVLKGGGFYKTDNRSGNGKRAGRKESDRKESESSASSGSKDSGSKDSGSRDSGSKDSGAKATSSTSSSD